MTRTRQVGSRSDGGIHPRTSVLIVSTRVPKMSRSRPCGNQVVRRPQAVREKARCNQGAREESVASGGRREGAA